MDYRARRRSPADCSLGIRINSTNGQESKVITDTRATSKIIYRRDSGGLFEGPGHRAHLRGTVSPADAGQGRTTQPEDQRGYVPGDQLLAGRASEKTERIHAGLQRDAAQLDFQREPEPDVCREAEENSEMTRGDQAQDAGSPQVGEPPDGICKGVNLIQAWRRPIEHCPRRKTPTQHRS